MAAEASFPQFSRLPVELQLQIVGHHRDSLSRNHCFRNSSLIYNANGNPLDVRNLQSCTLYHCKSLHGDAGIKNDAPDDNPAMSDCIYAGDGLASERIPLYHDLYRWNSDKTFYTRVRPAFYHGWANFATDVFTFTDTSQHVDSRRQTPSETFLRALERGAVSPLDYRGHWFWRVQKLALEVGPHSLAFGYGLSAYDKEALRRTDPATLKTVYVVIAAAAIAAEAAYYNRATLSLSSRCPCVAKPPFRTMADGFVAPEDYLVVEESPLSASSSSSSPSSPSSTSSSSTNKCNDAHEPFNPHAALRLATQLQGELEAVLRERPVGGGGGSSSRRPVEVLVVFSESKGQGDCRWAGVAGRPMYH